MKRFSFSMLFVASVLLSFAAIGCDKTVSEETTVQKKTDGTVVTDKEKTIVTPDGGTKTTTDHQVDR